MNKTYKVMFISELPGGVPTIEDEFDTLEEALTEAENLNDFYCEQPFHFEVV